jgi:uncharacterized protein YgiM (DUF1202 family)
MLLRSCFLAAFAVALVSAGSAGAGPLVVLPLAAGSYAQPAADLQMSVRTSYAHLRAQPTTKSDRLATLKHGTKVEVIELVDHGKWAHVHVAGKTGYISANLLTK